jgi:hypothetical protein
MLYVLLLPDGETSGLQVTVFPQARGSDLGAYCLPASEDVQRVTLAGLQMAYTLSGEVLLYRSWYFADSEDTAYTLQAGDVGAEAATQARDEAILNTFTPDDALPLAC